MGRKEQYIAQLRELDIYEPAFLPAVNDLVTTEHEYSRAMKAWREDAKRRNAPALTSDDAYAEVLRLRREVSSQREALGLTPRGLQKIRGRSAAEGVAGEGLSRKLDALLARCESYDPVPNPGTSEEAPHASTAP